MDGMTERDTTSRRPGIVLACVSACTVLVVGFVASVNLAVPLLSASGLHPSSDQLLWIVDAYVVFFACLVVPGGAAGDRYGRKGMLLAGLVVFALGAGVSAAAPGTTVLIAGRVVTGVGAAAVLPNSLAVLIHAVPAERRSAAIAVWASMSGVGGVIGNVGGGALLQTGSWRWLFAAVAPLALALALWAARVTPRSERHSRDLNPVAAGLLTVGTLAALLGITQGPEHGWASTPVIAAFAAAALLLAGWVVAELRARHPLLDPRLFAIPALSAASFGMIIMFFGSYGLFYLNSSLLQYVHHFSVLQAGLAIVPLTAPLLLAGRYVPHLVERVGVTVTVAAAFVVAAVGLWGLGSTARSGYWWFAAWLVVFGCGFALALPTLTAQTTAALPREQAGVGAGLQSTTRELGSALGVAVVGSILTAGFATRLHDAGIPGRPHTVAQADRADPARTGYIAASFAHASTSTLHITAVIVVLAGALITARFAVSDRRRHRPTNHAPQPAVAADLYRTTSTARHSVSP